MVRTYDANPRHMRCEVWVGEGGTKRLCCCCNGCLFFLNTLSSCKKTARRDRERAKEEASYLRRAVRSLPFDPFRRDDDALGYEAGKPPNVKCMLLPTHSLTDSLHFSIGSGGGSQSWYPFRPTDLNLFSFSPYIGVVFVPISNNIFTYAIINDLWDPLLI